VNIKLNQTGLVNIELSPLPQISKRTLTADACNHTGFSALAALAQGQLSESEEQQKVTRRFHFGKKNLQVKMQLEYETEREKQCAKGTWRFVPEGSRSVGSQASFSFTIKGDVNVAIDIYAPMCLT
jgi:hypothetical protein